MFAQILDCPYCRKRFNYEQTAKAFPARITCPECGQTGPYDDFSAIVLCRQCRKKVLVPLELLYNDDTLCPHCQTVLKADLPFLDEDASTYTLGGTRHSSADERILKDGEFFDKYKIIRLLGKGGMAEVYLAEHLLLKKRCALKLMQSSVAAEDQIFTKRFIREAKLTHQLVHPNIVNVFDAGSDFKTGHLFLAMEYVEGSTLTQLFREKQLSEAELTSVLLSILNALKVLNEAHVVHRDIKPSNIMLDSDGVFKLMDLGIAKSDSNHPAGEMTLTMEQSVIGTPGYASPEQCRSAHNVDIRSDLYCLGATLYHAASGVIPHDGETPMEIILKVLQDAPVPLKTYRPDLSQNFLTVIDKMMMKDPKDRPADPDAVLTLLGKDSRNFITRCKTIWDSTSCNIDLTSSTTFLKKHLPLISKLFRAAVILGLLLAIALTGNYLWNRSQGRSVGSFKEHLNNLISGKSAVPEKEKTAARSRQSSYHPMMKYPGEEDNQRFLRDSDSAKTPHFPVVTFFPSPPDMLLEFDQLSDKNKRRLSQICRGGILHWDEQNPRFPVLRLPETITNQNLTFSADLKITSLEKNNNFSLAGLSVSVEDKYLAVSISGTQRAILPVKIPEDRWFNITIIMEKATRKLTILSGNRLLGIFLYPSKTIFYTSHMPVFVSGKFERVVIYKSAKKYTLPEKSKRQYAPVRFSTERIAPLPEYQTKKTQTLSQPQTVSQPQSAPRPQPASSSPTTLSETSSRSFRSQEAPPRRQGRTIEKRIAECKERYTALANQQSFPLKTQTLEFISSQIRALNHQAAIRKRVLAAGQKRYSAQATNDFARELQAYYLSRKSRGGYRSSDVRKGKELIAMLKNPDVDPNVFIDPPGKDRMTVGDVLLAGHLHPQISFINALSRKNIDVNRISCKLLTRGSIGYTHQAAVKFLFLGMEDVDNPQGDPIVFSLLNSQGSRFDMIGSHITDILLNNFLQLAPQVDVIHPRDGRTLLHLAAHYNKPLLAEKLYYAGFTLWKWRDKNGRTPWDTALERGSREVADFLRKVNWSTPESSNDMTAIELCDAIRSKNAGRLRQLLRTGKIDHRKKFFTELDTLAFVCAMNDMSLLQCLKECGMDFSAVNHAETQRFRLGIGITHPLHIAVRLGNIRMMDFLLKQGVSANRFFPHYMGGRGTLPVVILYHARRKLSEQTAVNMIQMLFQNDKTLDINQNYYGYNVLRAACTRNFKNKQLQLHLIRFLINRGARINSSERESYWIRWVRDPQIRQLLQSAAR